MRDTFGREVTYLRVSVTDLCNLRCTYCMPESGVEKRQHADIMSIEEIDDAVHAAAACGIRKIRLTGGEPLVRRGILTICRNAAQTPGIEEICLTTNGVLLGEMAADLKTAGVARLNISLDTFNPETYRSITRVGTLQNVLDGMEAARRAGFENLKINCVLMQGVNDGEIRDLIGLTKENGDTVRFIELMPIGAAAGQTGYLSGDAVLRSMPELQRCGTDGVSELYAVPGWKGKVGLIAPISRHFCPTCNRIRLTADGKLKPCLHSAVEIPLRGQTRDEMEATIRQAILGKPERHYLEEHGISDAARGMSAIGG